MEENMSTFFMFGKYNSAESMKQISEDRTRKVLEVIKSFGGEAKAMYAMLGAYDLILIAEFININDALQASVSVTKSTGITFSTLPAVPVEEFDRLVNEI
jgi:uncharacterized protein with GYD domain